MSGLSLSHLSIAAPSGKLVVDDVSLEVAPGEVVGLVGESGSGKSMTSLALMGLLPSSMTVVSGDLTVDGVECLRGGEYLAKAPISIVFQNARASLNPTMRIGKQVCRLMRFQGMRQGIDEFADELMRGVGITDTERVLKAYPHQLSGGMNQRVMIALAMAARREYMIADEPTTGLDVTVQAQILDLLRRTMATSGMGVLMITHDLGVVAQLCDRVAVLRHGKLVETAGTDDLFHHAAEPYTRELVASATGGPGTRSAGAA